MNINTSLAHPQPPRLKRLRAEIARWAALLVLRLPQPTPVGELIIDRAELWLTEVGR